MNKNIQDYSTRKLLCVYFRAQRKVVRADRRRQRYYQRGDEMNYGLAKYAKREALILCSSCEQELIHRGVDINPTV
jgi:hypothetical protein